jgi:hypothetical protein
MIHKNVGFTVLKAEISSLDMIRRSELGTRTRHETLESREIKLKEKWRMSWSEISSTEKVLSNNSTISSSRANPSMQTCDPCFHE